VKAEECRLREKGKWLGKLPQERKAPIFKQGKKESHAPKKRWRERAIPREKSLDRKETGNKPAGRR